LSGRRIAAWLGGIVVALLLVVVTAVAALDTAPGKRFLLDRLASYTLYDGLNFRAAAIDGSVFGRMTLRGVEVRDLKGVLMTSPAVVVDWRPRAALHGKVDLDELSAEQIVLLRRPVLGPSDPTAPFLPNIDIAVRKLAVAQLIVDPAVTGTRHIVRIAGAVDIASGQARATADLAALRLPGVVGGDRLTLRLDAVPASNRLVIAARLAAPTGGLVDGVTGLGKPLSLGLDGSGSWESWNGALRGTAGDASLGRLALTARAGTFTLRGRLLPEPLLPAGPARVLVTGGIGVDTTARLAQRRVDLAVVVTSTAFVASANGAVDLGTNRFGDFKVAARLLRPTVLARDLNGRDIALTAMLDGPFATPTIDYRLSATALSGATTGIEGLTASGRATIDTRRILIPLHATARLVSGLNPAVGGLLTNVAIDGDLAWSNGQLLSDNLRLRSDRIAATAIVVADLAKGRYTGALKGKVADYVVAGLGRVDLITDARLITTPHGGFAITGSVRAATLSIDNASVRQQLGGNAVATAAFTYVPGGVATLRDLRLTAPQFRIISGSGSYAPNGTVALDARAASSRYGPITVTGSGTVERPVIRIVAPSPTIGVHLKDVIATLTGNRDGYRVKVSGGSAYGPFDGDFGIGAGNGPLAIDIARTRFAGITFSGRVEATANGLFTGLLTVSGSGLNGTVQLAAAGTVQTAEIDLAARAARIPGPTLVTIGSGRLHAKVALAASGPQGSGTATVADLRYGPWLVSRAQTRFDYQGDHGSAGIVASGTGGTPFDIAAQAAITPGRLVANARGSFAHIPFSQTAPAVATRTGGEWQLAPVTINTSKGQARIAARYGKSLAVNAVLDKLDLGLTEAFAPGLGLGGSASGTVSVTLPAGGGVPVIDARLTIANFTRTAAFTISRPVDIATRLQLSAVGGTVDAAIRSGGTVLGRLQAKLAPLAPGSGLTARLQLAPLSGGIRFNGPAEVPWALTGITGQQVSGPLGIAADFGGRLGQPTVTGVVRAKTLRYENEAYGTVVSDIALDGRFTRSQLELVSLTGKSGSGTVSAQGIIGLDATAGYPVKLALTFDNAQLARSDALGASASGTLAITNGPGGGLIKGTLTIPEARYQIIRQGAAEVAELAGVLRRGAPLPVADAPPPASNLRLDLHLIAPGRIFIRGMGLEAEWRTDMRITGTATSPVVAGRLQVVRGTYSFAGRRFDLAQDGAITFDGGPFANPQLALTASTTVNGVSATINIGGRAERPEITFTSTPALPQDEVLARLLFGGPVTSLSPTQAIQLAAALNSLRGSGGGLNPLGKLRSVTGIDRLRILGADKTAGRGTALAAGKYITNNIYVEVITDARGFTATQLEIALTRSLSLLSATSSFGGSNVSVRYSKDY
jgi:translocation and assembly module TamB